MRWSCILLLWVAQVAPLPAQETPFLLSRSDGKQWQVRWTGIRGQGADLQLRVRHLTQTRWVGIQEVLELHGPAPKVKASAAIYLVGGSELKGQITGGDEGGNTLTVSTPALGALVVQVDRLRCIVFRENAPLADNGFQLPEGTKREEALFKRARRGFDTILGEVERFTGEGILFVVPRADYPQLFRYRELAGYAFRGGYKAKDPGPVQLITTGGDLLRVHLLSLSNGKLSFRTEGSKLQIPLDRIASLAFLSVPGCRYLSELPVLREEERASADDLGTAPLFRFRRDRTASGGFVGKARHPADGFLTVHGHTYGRGLGVHSRSKLTFRVPKGCTRFHALVGIDDEVLATGIRGDADVQVKMRDKVLFQAKGLRRGQAPHNLGILKVEPGALLTLEVDFGKAMFLGDRVDWLNPVFLR
jgi:hypothetical protein